jgi:hypothetical protein
MLAKKYFVYLPPKKGNGRSLQAQLMRGGWGTHLQLEGINQEKE